MRLTPKHAEVITPAMADDWLTNHNNLNRPVRKGRIPDYAGRLERDEWMLNGETITFDTNGDIIDGQTRLEAIRRSGVPMRTFIITGLDPGVRPTVGGGVMRQFADDLSIMGVTDALHKGSIMRGAVLWDRTHGLSQLGHESVTRVGLGELWPKYEATVEEASPAKKHATGVPLTSGAASLFWWVLRRYNSDPSVIEEFFEVFIDGSRDRRDHGIVRLRKFLDTPHYNQRTGRKIGTPKQVEIYYLLLAWNDWLAGDENAPVRFRKPDKLTDPFPKPVTGKADQ